MPRLTDKNEIRTSLRRDPAWGVYALGDLAPHNLASIPAVVDANGVKIAISDAAVEDFPGLWLRGTSGSGAKSASGGRTRLRSQKSRGEMT